MSASAADAAARILAARQRLAEAEADAAAAKGRIAYWREQLVALEPRDARAERYTAAGVIADEA